MIATATDQSHPSTRIVPDVLIPKWQETIDLMARVYDVTTGVITRVHPEQLEIFLSSQTEGNPIPQGMREDLNMNLYCETVMSTRQQLHIPNALADPKWANNPEVEMGMIMYLGVPLFWPDGQIFGTICVLDTKPRHLSGTYQELLWKFKEIVEGDLRLMDELQRREQVEIELRQAKDAADRANQAKSAFLASMSHELRTPLNTILGFTRLVQRSQPLTPEQREYLRIVQRSGEHLLSLINNVLDLARIEAGRITLNATPVDLYQLLDDLEDMFHLRAADKRLQLVCAHASDVPRYIHIDGVKLRQVLINLLNNAIKFTTTGSVTLHVSRVEPPDTVDSASSNTQTTLHVAVADTGVGIAPEELPLVFEAFHQTASGRQAHEGTGLGLPISRRFVALMGGDLQLRSQVGQGTTVMFDIPVTVLSSDNQTHTTSRYVVGLTPGQPTYRILVVDDRWTNRHLLVQLLVPLGFEVREASNGQEALDIWQHWQPHLIWMDMRMPVMDGYEATRRIKSTTSGQATAVIALTASTLEEERAIILSAGCDDFVRKPFSEVDIFEIMRKHIGVDYIYADSPTMPPPLPPAVTLTAEDLTVLPPSLLASLEQAVITTAPDRINDLILQIQPEHAALAHTLTYMVDEFEYAELLARIKEARAYHAV